MGKREHSTIMTKVVEDAGRCELCGSRRGLEAHHIIPVVCGGADSDDNLICVCQCCHARLTPRSLLTKIGKDNVRRKNLIVEFKLRLYDAIELKAANGGDIYSVFDAIEETW